MRSEFCKASYGLLWHVERAALISKCTLHCTSYCSETRREITSKQTNEDSHHNIMLYNGVKCNKY